MGDWWLGNDNEWHYDQTAGQPDPTVTAMLPAVPRDEPEDDGHVNPAEFPHFDTIDSRMIRPLGAPD